MASKKQHNVIISQWVKRNIIVENMLQSIIVNFAISFDVLKVLLTV